MKKKGGDIIESILYLECILKKKVLKFKVEEK